MAEESAGFVVPARERRHSFEARFVQLMARPRPAARALREVPPEERPRERLERFGPASLSSAELLALVWGTGGRGRNVLDLAADALVALGGVAGLAAASGAELAAVPGIGPARAAQLQAALELGRRLASDWPTGRLTVHGPGDLARHLLPQMGRLEREELRVVLLNTKNAVVAVETVYRGNVSTALVRVGELFRDAVRQHAAGLIIVHNHPSGDPTPSPDDLHLTAEAVAAGRLLDLPVLDHLILGHDAYVSLRDRGVRFDGPGPHRAASAERPAVRGPPRPLARAVRRSPMLVPGPWGETRILRTPPLDDP